MSGMTNQTQLKGLDTLHDSLCILEGNLRCEITDIKTDQQTLELIILARGLLAKFPDAGLLRVEIHDGGAIPVRLSSKTNQDDAPAFPEGPELDIVDLEGWTVLDLLESIARGSNRDWINRVDALADPEADPEDPHFVSKTEFDLDLAKTAALPVPSLEDVNARIIRAANL